ncbi:tRNA (N6-threonylcarbamoyladenosine(37)-N6)-methyltransferase TrmO [Candidatus Sordicultor fermentans]|jgi:tRNA-Thr(GGU) m(6)t(6)A37 methyltransferase TsaA|uniref:tRNA (N6-threonylcarbamoyladenosine(37)-N6)-methyltransferase TrmO n=1 Tax=Candidatus Sordicultor fermentans TaxID=1953203 RepID=UPI0016A3AE27|nr:tRNA (N6-threonylcarbamoyladenosine(37)-N6)-methyltransferase TrmO [Atribacterota bacterium]NLY05499.1 tRNA (N6-threonylcarbamoyladenosine(37)-N6)-methyltransferase TrmO [Candidatus Atribacteria bacterium]MDI9607876.1 tRNA (N6-threonylcarbamoyladenosine(37)-N6)-methyltransferase TrmO [Atribacterota bacterium]HOA98625.1 tRNA (N6-threonylcarbamoyladenosine(37)-N6)-methyltransferase TrmO [Candidatus Atribacteria bacterium]HOQ50232.1 tRNA (N6-threonylcarbamoyladenosine(37)-N6)-methyltransferase 
MMQICYQPIGIIHSPYLKPEGTPIQPRTAGGVSGTVEIFDQYVEGLQDLEGFSHIILIYHFHLARPGSLKVKPFLDQKLRGVFATRAPSRPNPIGLSVVKLLKVENNLLSIQELDILDGTPLLDIKPYLPDFDSPPVEKRGWLEEKLSNLPYARDDGRFAES